MSDAPSSTATSPSTRSGGAAQGPRSRPEFRNIGIGDITRYRMPMAAIVSILHRISGALMFLVGIPVMLYLFQNSLRSEVSFERYLSAVSSFPAKLVLLVLLWALIHHLLAGIRFLLLDLHIGVDKPRSAASAKSVLIISVVLTLLVALRLFGAF